MESDDEEQEDQAGVEEDAGTIKNKDHAHADQDHEHDHDEFEGGDDRRSGLKMILGRHRALRRPSQVTARLRLPVVRVQLQCACGRLFGCVGMRDRSGIVRSKRLRSDRCAQNSAGVLGGSSSECFRSAVGLDL
eukprot:g688.t1